MNRVSCQAPSAPIGSATMSATSAYPSTIPRYTPATWRSRAPTAFIIPIWRVCWAMIAEIVLITRNPDTARLSTPIAPRIRNTALRTSWAGCSPGVGTWTNATGAPAFSRRSRTSPATARAWARVPSGFATRMRSSLKESSKPRSARVSKVT